MQLLLDVWREVCRHIEIGVAVDRIAPLIAGRIPADLVLVRRLDPARFRLETAAVGACRVGARPPRTRTDCGPNDMRRVLAWCREGRLRRGFTGDGDPILSVIVPSGTSGEVLAGALLGADGPIGVLLLLAARSDAFSVEHESLVQALLEPFSVALANDSRLQELTRLREALEADKRALLSRLERQDVADTLVGADAGLRTVMARAKQVAPTDAPVLILGETGTGKEVLARAIHARSRRASGPVVRVNCGALPPGLVDSELFGHERGSFTGAVNTRKGWFERADGGTLFLDEVAELPLDAQVRLLRILQDGTFERVGGQKPLSVDVRIVAATHRDLPDMVTRGSFREDLWYRIGVFPIRLPPLRERREDIPILAAHFALRAGLRLAGAPLTPSADDMELLMDYSWPGNVRELASVIERAAILGDGRQLHVAAALGLVGSPVEHASPASHTPRTTPPRSTAVGAGLVPLDAAMVRHITGALEAARGRIEGPRGAAAMLGINPHTLRARMRKLGIDWARFRERSSGHGSRSNA